MARRQGFSLIEVLVAMTLTGIVVAGTLKALTAQKKFYARQARILDARHALRASTTILASEFREASATDNDLYAVAADSAALRSTVGFAIVCGVHGGSGQLSLTHTSGHFQMGAADSALVFVENTAADDDDAWRVLPVSGISTSGPGCDGISATPDLVVNASGSFAGIWVGAPLRLFRPHVFRLYQMDGRWWLGRRNRASATGFLPVAGPLAPPADGGLLLTFFRQDGTVTNDPTQVHRVHISIRAPTYRTLTDPDYRELNTSAHLRNNG